MGSVSYSAHISNGKSAITSKSKLQGVAMHNLRKYRSGDYSSEHILLLEGTENLYQDVKNIYQKEFDVAVREYNEKQKRTERRIDDYFEHVSKLDQDMAVEIIFQCGDKQFWEEHQDSKERMYHVYRYVLSRLQEFLPDFKVANAVIHFDEASPHMHVVGVPVWSETKKGLSKKVSKRNVFTPTTLSVVLQDKLREDARSCFRFNIHEIIGDKKKGRNYDLSVAEYKVQQELQNLHEVKSEKKQVETSITSSRQKLAYLKVQYDELDEEIQSDLTNKKRLFENLDAQLETKKLLLDITDEELKQKSAFIELLDVVKQMIQSYLPLQPDIEEFANTVERGEGITGGNSFLGFLSALGQLLLSFKEMIQEGFCWFPRLMKWTTSKDEVAPVFRDDPDGHNYKLEGFRNIETKDICRVENLKEEICSENRIGTLEQIQGSVELLEDEYRKRLDNQERNFRR